MKKIVGIIAAVAMAASVFAIDVASMLQLDGDLATFSKDETKALMLKEWDPQGTADFVWKFSVSGDKAGATIFNFAPGDSHWVTTKDPTVTSTSTSTSTSTLTGTNPVTVTTETTTTTDTKVEWKEKGSTIQNWSLWFKPTDSIKVTAGYIDYDYGVKPHFGWWAQVIAREDYGIKADFSFGALNVSAGLAGNYEGLWSSGAAGSYWFNKNYVGSRKLGEFWVGGAYNIDGVGTVGASVNRGAKVNPHGFAQTQCWGKTPFAINAYFANQPWGQTGYFADIAFVMKEKNPYGGSEADFKMEPDRVTGAAYLEFHADAFVLYVNDVFELNLAKELGTMKKFKDGFEIKAQYAIDAYTPYIQIDGYGIMDKSLGIKTAVGFNVGTVAIDVGANFALNFASDFACVVTVPFELTINL